TPQHFNAMLASMYKGEGSHFDHLLRFTKAVTGAAFFAPSEGFLMAQGK
ncbi:MAG: Dyp-type peroxidase, partial [Aeromonas veronii]